MPPAAVIFDLDGTLLDTLADIAAAANRVLEREGFPTHSQEAYRRLVGRGVTVLFRRALPESRRDDETVARCVAGFHEIYDLTWNVQTRPYDGIPELLDELTARGLPLAVLSNKPHDFTVRCIAEYLGRWKFAAVVGAREGVPHKPDPTSALKVARQLGTEPSRCVYLGDSDVDMETARRAGMRPIGAAWGFRTTEELRSAAALAVIAQPQDLLRCLDTPMG
ncbi:MAG: HAD family hydrolase [Planctomycetes bacterium]|nr:HAD family hydrolase [Planctomycetota bacterium]